MSGGPVERRVADLIQRSRAGLDAVTWQQEVLRRLRAVVSVDAAFIATVDPATLVFTSAMSESPLYEATPLFLANEYGTRDVNKFTELAVAVSPVQTLDRATQDDRGTSARSRDVMTPLGLGDELRVALRSGNAVWGVMCLHRAASQFGFSDTDIAIVERVAPHIATGLRHAVLLARARNDDRFTGAGLVLLDPETFAITGANGAADALLEELPRVHVDGAERVDRAPVVIEATARLARDARSSGTPTLARVRVQGRSGRWLAVHGSVLDGRGGPDQLAVVIEPADRSDVASLLLELHELTPREREVAQLVLRGYSTRQIVAQLHITANTVQDHLKSIFEKFGVSSRRELVASLLGR